MIIYNQRVCWICQLHIKYKYQLNSSFDRACNTICAYTAALLYLNSNCCCLRFDDDKFDDDVVEQELNKLLWLQGEEEEDNATCCWGPDLCLRFNDWPVVELCGTIVIPAPNEGKVPLLPPPPPPLAPVPAPLVALIDVPGKQRYNDIDGAGKCCINLPFWKSKLLMSMVSPKWRANCGLLSIRFPVGLYEGVV